jgi:hypothetical protein
MKHSSPKRLSDTMCSIDHISWALKFREINRLSLAGSLQEPPQEVEHTDADMGADCCRSFSGSTREAAWLATTNVCKP